MANAKQKKRQGSPEHDLQCQVFKWTREIGQFFFPELEVYRSVTSGQPRYGWQVNWFKEEGLEPGYPDTHLSVSREPWVSLWIEHKASNGVLSSTQKERIKMLREYGHCVCVSKSVNLTIAILVDYILMHDIPESRQ